MAECFCWTLAAGASLYRMEISGEIVIVIGGRQQGKRAALEKAAEATGGIITKPTLVVVGEPDSSRADDCVPRGNGFFAQLREKGWAR